MRDLIREEADKYQDFFNFMSNEHNLTLTISEMDEIVYEAQALVKKFNKPEVSGRSEQLDVKENQCCGRCIDGLDKCIFDASDDI